MKQRIINSNEVKILSLQPFVNAALEIAEEGNAADQMAYSVSENINFYDLIKLVDMDIHGPAHYYYKGSLTTPTCNEVVNWLVMENTIEISEHQVRYHNHINIKLALWMPTAPHAWFSI